MNYLLRGGYKPEKLALMLSLTSIRSEDIRAAIHDHLVEGAAIDTAAALNMADAGNLKRALKKLNETARIVEEIKNIDLRKSDTSKQVALVTDKKPARTKKPDAWKEFFKAYPDNKKGGVDTSAWKAAKSEGLTEEDFVQMLDDVIQRGNLMPSWRKTYAQGIVKYIRDRIWLTPIKPETGTLKEVQYDAFGAEIRSTRDLSTQELISDRSWAD
jgi:hypothetical protein